MGIYNIVFCITTAFYMYIISRLLDTFLGEKKCSFIIIILEYIAFYGSLIAVFFIHDNPIWNLTLSVTFILLLTTNYKSNWKHKIFFGVLTYIIMFASDEIVYIATQTSGLSIEGDNEEILNVFVLVISRFIAYTFSLVLSNRKREIDSQTLPLLNWIVVFTIPVLTTFLTGTIIVHYEVFNSWVLIFSIIALVIINLIIFNLYDLLQKFFKSHFDEVIMKNQINSYKKQLDLIYTSQENSKALLHDMKNHLTIIGEFLRINDSESARKYLLDINKEMSVNTTRIITGNLEIDSILNYKSNQARKKGIRINIKSNIPRKLNISPFDLNIVLGNLIDNAIEATVMGKSKADIDISIKLEKGIVYIKTRNFYLKKPKYFNGEIVTSKMDKKAHGYGLKSVKSTVKKYNGDISLSYADNIFEVIVLLYNV